MARRTGRAGVQWRGRWCADAGRTQIAVEGFFPGSVLLHLHDRFVDLGQQFRIVQSQPDSVVLRGERLADDRESAGELGGETCQDHLVGAHGVDRPVAQCLHARRVGVVLLQLDAGIFVLDALCRCGTRHRAQPLAGCQRLGSGDVGSAGANQQALPGVEVGPREGDLLLARVRDRVGRHDVIDLVVLDQRLALARR